MILSILLQYNVGKNSYCIKSIPYLFVSLLQCSLCFDSIYDIYYSYRGTCIVHVHFLGYCTYMHIVKFPGNLVYVLPFRF